MDRGDFVHGFDFDHDQILDQQVDAVTQFQPNPAINDRQADLTGGTKSSLHEFVLQQAVYVLSSKPGPNSE